MKAIDRLLRLRQSQVKEAINTLTDMAVDNREHLHILVSVTAHTNDVAISAYPTDFDWSQKQFSQPIFLQSVNLSEDSSLLKLLEVEDQLIDLIAEVREVKESEVAA